MPRPDRVPARRRTPARVRTPALLALAGAIALPSCRYLPSFGGPEEPPPATTSSAAGVGATWSLDAQPIGGSPIGADAPADAAAPEYRAQVRLLEFASRDALPSADLPAWIFAKGADEPLEPAPRFTAEAAAGWLGEDGLESGGEADAVRADLDLPLGVGAGWSVAALVGGQRPIELLVWSDAAGELGAALAAEGQVPRLELNESQESAIGALGRDLLDGSSGREIAPLPAKDGARGVWCLVPTSGGGVLAIEVIANAAPDEGPRGLAHAREIAAVRAGVDERHHVPMLDPLLVEARDDAARRRALLVELARGSNRPLLLDLILFATDEQLARWTGRAAETAVLGDRLAQAWSLERTALLDQAREADLGHVDASLAAVLRVHLGALGSEPSLLADVVRRASGASAFGEALVNETEQLLFDPRPAVRVRAYRWLAARGLGPANYDPLADRTSRRAALDDWRRTTAEAATASAAGGTATTKSNGAAGGANR